MQKWNDISGCIVCSKFSNNSFTKVLIALSQFTFILDHFINTVNYNATFYVHPHILVKTIAPLCKLHTF